MDTPRDRLQKLLNRSQKSIQKTRKSVKKETRSTLKNIGQGINELGKNTKLGTRKFVRNIQRVIQPGVEKVKIITTTTGRKIKAHQKEIALVGSGIVVGITGRMIWEKTHEHDDPTLNEYLEQSNLINEYQLIAKSDAEQMSTDDWRGMVANISAQLETQLRYQTKIDNDKNANLFNLLQEAEKEGLLSGDELDRLHEFRNHRNKLIHDSEFSDVNPETVFWAADFVNNF